MMNMNSFELTAGPVVLGALVLLGGAVLLVWMFSQKRRDD